MLKPGFSFRAFGQQLQMEDLSGSGLPVRAPRVRCVLAGNLRARLRLSWRLFSPRQPLAVPQVTIHTLTFSSGSDSFQRLRKAAQGTGQGWQRADVGWLAVDRLVGPDACLGSLCSHC